MSCDVVKKFLQEYLISLETQGQEDSGKRKDDAEQQRHLAIAYGLYTVLGMTFTFLPFSSLGLDLARKEDIREVLFATKAWFIAGANIALAFLQVYASTRFSADFRKQMQITTNVGEVALMIGSVILLFFVTSPKRAPAVVRRGSEHPLRIAREFCSNIPFCHFVAYQIAALVAQHVSVSTIYFLFKFTLKQENSQQALSYFTAIFFICTIMHTKGAASVVKGFNGLHFMTKVPAFASFGHLFVFISCFLTSIQQDDVRMWLVLLVVPTYLATFPTYIQLSTQHILSQVVDYHSLFTGHRREGLFTVVDHTLLQMIDVFVGPFPLYALGLAGYKSNGGCSCGCGAKCKLPIQRWKCPGDVGWACSSALQKSNPPLFGDPNRQPPCLTEPQTAANMILFLFFVVPFFSFCMCSILATRFSLDSDTYKTVVEQKSLVSAGRPGFDPVAMRTILPNRSIDLGWLSEREIEMLKEPKGYRRLSKSVADKVTSIGFVAICLMLTLFTFQRIAGALTIILLIVVLPSFVYHAIKLSLVINDSARVAFVDANHGLSKKQSGKLTESFAIHEFIKQRMRGWFNRSKCGRQRQRNVGKRHSV
mmetsp:Transcript_30090/g.77986  ORF Transcript_30090/g.77986 Transcript_30090/m.77986 type:complete len:593 (+) Transcript_30090:730-2508(+)|eukprot:CAMPEP_0115835340 /NCGR_PEP_ID=MMETSP0287-20121206/4144_1 /TAXON_ID=412157 /ORGANISM="Chrysochromulina rotalis, Strain UIO044" /LENGTH=592 /DNA_ID=CAMNT_0003288795 /DNA_START=647 /DNA_END=2425 /DNA_ORIENTATION=-